MRLRARSSHGRAGCLEQAFGLASTRTAPRNATTRASPDTCAIACWGEIAPIANRMTAAGTAAAASGQPRGRATANPRTTASSISATASVKG
ncbi:Uncharacterised protein [Mycobacterium tuberculosis]|uniref:Uncharacterized protein n=1 Tax=Mycobacterium tuberculosis TaxID=1773 RepID=A0A916LGR6_MYCTX|nr:Uncharacterised protein [Mycobacterium tuberculosis]